jgi:hypothetical protein
LLQRLGVAGIFMVLEYTFIKEKIKHHLG